MPKDNTWDDVYLEEFDEIAPNWLRSASIPILEMKPRWTRAKIYTDGLLIPVGQLTTFDFDAVIEQLHQSIEESILANRIIIGGVFIALNNPTEFQFYFDVLIGGKNDGALREAIQEAFPPEPTVSKPYKFQAVRNVTKPLLPLSTSRTYQRYEFSDDPKIDSLRMAQLVEWWLFTERVSADTFYILRGVRRVGDHLIPTKSVN